MECMIASSPGDGAFSFVSYRQIALTLNARVQFMITVNVAVVSMTTV